MSTTTLKTMLTMEEFANTVLSLSPNMRTMFYDELQNILSEEEYKALLQCIAVFGLFDDPAKYNAMRDAMCEVAYKIFTGKELNR